MYSDLEVSCNPSVSIWGPGHAITTTGSLYQPLKAQTQSVSKMLLHVAHQAVAQTVSTFDLHLLSLSQMSASSTPAYSQTLSLESTMLQSSTLGLSTPLGLPTTVIAGQERHAQAAGRGSSYSSTVGAAPPRSINPRQGGRRQKSFVDPCEIAPLKKRRIQVLYMLNIVKSTLEQSVCVCVCCVCDGGQCYTL